MIPIFRKIRKKMADENKPLKYIRYAIGEIILVVIGILIALSINNWNEARKQKLAEIDILEGIRTDILKDTVDLNFNIRAYTKFIKQDSLTLNHLINKKQQDQSLVQGLHNSANADWSIILHDSYFQEAKQRGLSIISNTNLRETISRLYEFEYKYLILMDNSSEAYDHSKLLRQQLGQYLGYDASGFIINKANYNKLLSNPNIIYNIKKGQQAKRFLLEIHIITLALVLKVAENINKELTFLKNN